MPGSAKTRAIDACARMTTSTSGSTRRNPDLTNWS